MFELMEQFRLEVCSAIIYSERYLQNKLHNPELAETYRLMAIDSIAHANNLIEIGNDEAVDMPKWEKCVSDNKARMDSLQMIIG